MSFCRASKIFIQNIKELREQVISFFIWKLVLSSPKLFDLTMILLHRKAIQQYLQEPTMCKTKGKAIPRKKE